MGKNKIKFYVVWEGREPGVYLTWDECKAQTHEYPQAKYKSFPSLGEARMAFASSYEAYYRKGASTSMLDDAERLLIGDPIKDSIAVDGAWNTITRVVEYQGRYLKTNEILFHVGPLEDGTNNIVEFLAIVHALALCKQRQWHMPIYSDSRRAISWVREKKAKTDYLPSEKNKKLFEMLSRAELWLKSNTFENTILKWETKAWGENPADFGRK